MSSALPETIKALRVLPDHKGLEVATIPWASQEKVKNLAENEIVVRATCFVASKDDADGGYSFAFTPSA